MLWVAILNGYPIVYPDTGEYLQRSLELSQSPYRAILYSIFMRLSGASVTPWLVIFVQSVMTVYVLCLVIDYFIRENADEEGWSRRDTLAFFALIMFLAFGTSLPWFVSQLMPDIFSGIAFLAVFLLLYDVDLSVWRTTGLSIVLFISVGSHLSNFPSLVLLLAAVLVLRFFKGARLLWPEQSIKRGLVLVLVPILASVGLAMVKNWRSGFGFTPSAGTSGFLLGRLIESGLARDYLEQQCKVEQLTPCRYLDNLPKSSDEFLWGSHSLFTQMGGWIGSRPEASKIVYGTIRRYPFRFLFDCGKQMIRQFLAFGAGYRNDALRDGNTVEVLKHFWPAEVPIYEAAKQWSGQLQRIASRVYPVYQVVFWACLCAGLGLLIVRRSEAGRFSQLFPLTVIFLFSNALVAGAVSGVHDRYQSRVAWLVGFCFALYLLQVFIKRQKAGQPQGSGAIAAVLSRQPPPFHQSS